MHYRDFVSSVYGLAPPPCLPLSLIVSPSRYHVCMRCFSVFPSITIILFIASRLTIVCFGLPPPSCMRASAGKRPITPRGWRRWKHGSNASRRNNSSDRAEDGEKRWQWTWAWRHGHGDDDIDGFTKPAVVTDVGNLGGVPGYINRCLVPNEAPDATTITLAARMAGQRGRFRAAYVCFAESESDHGHM